MNNFIQLIQEIAVFFDISDFVMEKEDTINFEIANDTLSIDNHEQCILISVSRVVSAYDTDIPEKALKLCDLHSFPYPIRVGLSQQNQLFFTVPIAKDQCSSQVLLKIFEHLKTLHNSL